MSGIVLPVAPEVALDTDLERAAAAWIRPYDQAWHLMRARDWLVHIAPDASLEMRLAAMVHDIERMFPGSPKMNMATQAWDDPYYLFAHSLRSAESVSVWLTGQGEAAAGVDEYEVRRLVALHELGGLRGADEVQAGDSLSFLETLAELTRNWVRSGVCSKTKGAEKLQYMADRIRIPAAMKPAAELLEAALEGLDQIKEEEVTRS
ncbi:hypothetical protein HC028_14870 [Planosporangium flavigriseum]|uniref:HD domain-containing protein n=1 Tax=Planosporangium flavigriseum TaxID=373681 RepID=A0A8J3LKR9_9ACTN|nr:hypothetical protein [Planosporangium flavigriseum]NJC65773.1 hypothetical protein [Planosporangium flavigriseum]GIG73627.1 hypothetical protein Pfl04_20310 [Planosporangium flavigriseum]